MTPEKRIAFEYNGSYAHSSKFKGEYYHSGKYLTAKQNGFLLAHIWDYHWDHMKELVQAYVGSLIQGTTPDIKFEEWSEDEYLNHPSLSFHRVPAERYIGVYDENGLVAIMSFTENVVHELNLYAPVDVKYILSKLKEVIGCDSVFYWMNNSYPYKLNSCNITGENVCFDGTEFGLTGQSVGDLHINPTRVNLGGSWVTEDGSKNSFWDCGFTLVQV